MQPITNVLPSTLPDHHSLLHTKNKLHYKEEQVVQLALNLKPPTLQPTPQRLLEAPPLLDDTFPRIPTAIGNSYQRHRLVKKQETPQHPDPLKTRHLLQTGKYFS